MNASVITATSIIDSMFLNVLAIFNDYFICLVIYNTKYHHPPHLSSFMAEGAQSSVGKARIEASSENAHVGRWKGDKLPRKSTQRQISKRKQLELDSENLHCDRGNELYQHKNIKIPKVPSGSHSKAGGKLAQGTKGNRCPARGKLIPGQTKLTQFFML